MIDYVSIISTCWHQLEEKKKSPRLACWQWQIVFYCIMVNLIWFLFSCFSFSLPRLDADCRRLSTHRRRGETVARDCTCLCQTMPKGEAPLLVVVDIDMHY